MLKLKVTISAKVYDKHGNLVRKYRPRAAHSFLAQFIETLHVQMSKIPTNITHLAGNEIALVPSLDNFRVQCGASSLNYGILIGSGNTPVDIDDYTLETKITANLTVSVHTFVLSYPTPKSRRLAISRTFINALASPMPIEEVALYTDASATGIYCLDRTLYSVAIPASSSLALTYRITVSV